MFGSILNHYQWQLSLYAAVVIVAVSFIGGKLLSLIPTIKQAQALNGHCAQGKMARDSYAENQSWSRKSGMVSLAVIFGLILPFCLTPDARPWWKVLRDVLVILIFYDFFYYLVHRFLFHDGGFLGGPLVRVHAVHHRQRNPCRMDSSYIHHLEVAMGLGLYAGSIFVLSRLIGNFHVATIVLSWVAFTQINLHNHDLWKAEHFPYRYLSYTSKMHHHHHARFTGGNFATISPLFDWLFGTYDTGNGYGKRSRRQDPPVLATGSAVRNGAEI